MGVKTSQTYKPGERLSKGAVSGISLKQIDEIVGGAGVVLRVVGRRLIISLENTNTTTGGSSQPRIVATLPAISSKYDVVTWGSSGSVTGGTGDDQVWEVDGRVGQTAWTPCQFLTSESGTP